MYKKFSHLLSANVPFAAFLFGRFNNGPKTPLPKELRGLYPFKLHHFENKHGTTLSYFDEGHGEAILCLHGNPTWSFYYRNVAHQLRHQYRVIALDHENMGMSDRSNRACSLADHIENVLELIKHLNLSSVTIIGHDWGGAIACGVAKELRLKELHLEELHPEEMQGMTPICKLNRLVLLNTAAFFSPDIPWQIALCRLPVLGNFLVKWLNMFAFPALTMAVTRPLPLPVKKGLIYPYGQGPWRKGVFEFVKDIPIETNHRTRKTLNAIEAFLPKLTVPTLFIWGTRDFCFHTGFLRQFQKIMPWAETVEFHFAGHYVLEDASEESIKVLKAFLVQTKFRQQLTNKEESTSQNPIPVEALPNWKTPTVTFAEKGAH